MNSIIDTVSDKWRSGRRTKIAPSGWLSGNAPCCVHRNQNSDKRGRGGIKFDGTTLSGHCFNCGFSCSYSIGKPLYPKFAKFMEWLGIDETTIKKLKFEALKLSKENNPESQIVKVRRDIKSVALPECSILENNGTHQKHIDFLATRGFTCDDYSFLVSSETIYKSRVILPFILSDTIIGYTARSIVSSEQTRYIMKLTTDYVFGLDWVEPEHEWLIVTEGVFDALSIKCLSVMHNEISEVQTEMICDLQKNVIVVPHLDKAGLESRNNTLINTALDCGWSVAYPEWLDKDINAAYVKYGPLFVTKHLLNVATNNPTKIRLKQKLLLSDLKSKTSRKK